MHLTDNKVVNNSFEKKYIYVLFEEILSVEEFVIFLLLNIYFLRKEMNKS